MTAKRLETTLTVYPVCILREILFFWFYCTTDKRNVVDAPLESLKDDSLKWRILVKLLIGALDADVSLHTQHNTAVLTIHAG